MLQGLDGGDTVSGVIGEHAFNEILELQVISHCVARLSPSPAVRASNLDTDYVKQRFDGHGCGGRSVLVSTPQGVLAL